MPPQLRGLLLLLSCPAPVLELPLGPILGAAPGRRETLKQAFFMKRWSLQRVCGRRSM